MQCLELMQWFRLSIHKWDLVKNLSGGLIEVVEATKSHVLLPIKTVQSFRIIHLAGRQTGVIICFIISCIVSRKQTNKQTDLV